MKSNRAIYRLWHNESSAGKVGYIGKDTNYPRRINLVRRLKEKNCPKLYRALRKYPLNVWHKEILAFGFQSDEPLNRAEIFYIAKFDSKRKGYNCTDGGEGRSGSSPSLKTRKKLSKLNKGKRIGKKASFYGHKHSPETKAHWSEIRKGRKLSSRAKAILLKSLIGRKVSKETKAKIGAAQKGKIVSKETRIKISLANAGHRAWNKGKKWSKSIKKKISASTSKSIKLWWKNRKRSA
jgi:group I intron endonuclease